SSSSSSSFNDAVLFVVVYDSTNSEIKVYSVSDAQWILLGSISVSISDVSSLRIDTCGTKVGIAFVDTYIKYNFFDLDSLIWSFESFQTLVLSQSYGEIIDMDFSGYSHEDNGMMFFGWVSKTANTSYTNSAK
ncbi:unnamed protein product, partial [marine sediment metagenome]